MSRSRTEFTSTPYWVLKSNYHFLEYKFQPIKAFVLSTKDMIEKKQEELKTSYDDFNKNRPKGIEDYPEAYDIFETEILNQGEYPKLLYNSMFLTIYSMLETEFNKICKLCKRVENLKLNYDDLSGNNYLQQSKDYLTKVVEVDLSNINEEWKKLKVYQVIRNTITHRQGKFKSQEKHHIDFIELTKSISIDPETNEIIIETEEFLNQFIDLSVSFLTKISQTIVQQKEKI